MSDDAYDESRLARVIPFRRPFITPETHPELIMDDGCNNVVQLSEYLQVSDQQLVCRMLALLQADATNLVVDCDISSEFLRVDIVSSFAESLERFSGLLHLCYVHPQGAKETKVVYGAVSLMKPLERLASDPRPPVTRLRASRSQASTLDVMRFLKPAASGGLFLVAFVDGEPPVAHLPIPNRSCL